MYHYSRDSAEWFANAIYEARKQKPNPKANPPKPYEAYEVADELDISRDTYYRIERGQMPDSLAASVLAALVRFYALDIYQVTEKLGIPLKE